MAQPCLHRPTVSFRANQVTQAFTVCDCWLGPSIPATPLSRLPGPTVSPSWFFCLESPFPLGPVPTALLTLLLQASQRSKSGSPYCTARCGILLSTSCEPQVKGPRTETLVPHPPPGPIPIKTCRWRKTFFRSPDRSQPNRAQSSPQRAKLKLGPQMGQPTCPAGPAAIKGSAQKRVVETVCASL